MFSGGVGMEMLGRGAGARVRFQSLERCKKGGEILPLTSFTVGFWNLLCRKQKVWSLHHVHVGFVAGRLSILVSFCSLGWCIHLVCKGFTMVVVPNEEKILAGIDFYDWTKRRLCCLLCYAIVIIYCRDSFQMRNLFSP